MNLVAGLLLVRVQVQIRKRNNRVVVVHKRVVTVYVLSDSHLVICQHLQFLAKPILLLLGRVSQRLLLVNALYARNHLVNVLQLNSYIYTLAICLLAITIAQATRQFAHQLWVHQKRVRAKLLQIVLVIKQPLSHLATIVHIIAQSILQSTH